MKDQEYNIHDRSWGKSVFKHGKWYLTSSLLAKGAQVYLLPVYTRYLSPSEYGILNSLHVVALLMPIFISLYLDSAFGRFFHEFKHNKEDLAKLFSTIYWFVLGFGSVVVAIAVLTSSLWVPSLLQVPVWPYVVLAFIPPLFLQLGNLGLVFLKQSLQAKQTTLVDVSTTIIGIAVTLPLLIFFKMGILAKLWGTVATAVFLAGFYTIYFYRRNLLKPIFDKKILLSCLAYSVPLIPNIAGIWLAGMSDRLVLAKYTNLENVGIYSLAYQIGMGLYVIQDAITQVTGPISMSGLIHDKEKAKRKITKLVLVLFGFMLFCHLGVVCFSKELVMLLSTKAYYGAYKLVGIIGLAYVFHCLYRAFTDIVSYHKKVWIIALSSVFRGGVGLSLNIILVPIYGYFASAYAFVISVFIYFLIIFVFSQRLEKIEIEWSKVLKILLVYILLVISVVFFLFDMEVSFAAFFIKTFVILLFGLFVYYVCDLKSYGKMLVTALRLTNKSDNETEQN
jgi:O-antigen/teichoic acid export membrane protein